MQYCPKCRVHIAGGKTRCPLCQHPLKPEPDSEENIFPPYVPDTRDHSLPLRIASAVALGVIVINVVINLILQGVFWSGFVIGGVICVWVVFVIGLKKKHNIFKNISWQLFFATIFLFLWDKFTGGYGWSRNYALPCLYGAALLFTFLWGTLRRTPAEEYLGFTLLDSLYCLIPGAFLLTGNLTIRIPSAICAGLGVIIMAVILIFKWKFVAEELRRRLHI